MKRFLYITILLLTLTSNIVRAQERKVQNRPYTDLRPFHFGILVGTHLQDLEFINAGPQIITSEDGSTIESLVTVDQDRWDPGFQVGVLGEFRLHENFQLRVAPAMYFGTRHMTFRNHTPDLANNPTIEEYQEMKSAYVSCAFDLIFAAPRFNNHRPYMMAGINPMINLSAKDNDYLKLKRFDTFLELGLGCDFYLPFFKARPELKFMYDADQVRDRYMKRFAASVNEAHSKMIVLTLYFE